MKFKKFITVYSPKNKRIIITIINSITNVQHTIHPINATYQPTVNVGINHNYVHLHTISVAAAAPLSEIIERTAHTQRHK